MSPAQQLVAERIHDALTSTPKKRKGTANDAWRALSDETINEILMDVNTARNASTRIPEGVATVEDAEKLTEVLGSLLVARSKLLTIAEGELGSYALIQGLIANAVSMETLVRDTVSTAVS